MADIKISDLVDQSTIDQIKDLNTNLQAVLNTYIIVAKDLAKGLTLPVKGLDDLEKMQDLLSQKSKEAAAANAQLTQVVAQQGQVIANTTNTISRQLMEQERVNKIQRESYSEYDRVKKLLDHFHDTYEGQVQSLISVNRKIEENKQAQKENEKALKQSKITLEEFTAKEAELISRHRSLAQEKKTLTQIMTAEEKAAQSQEGSYVHMSQQLELLKKAYKDLNEEGRNSDFGKELENAIQNLDAHLKDTAADMGEFQRNVGNYAIAGRNGVVATESLIAVIRQEAVTMKDVADQTKILTEAKGMLDTSDTGYGETLDAINAKLAENRARLTDVSDIMNTHAASIAEAEAQNQRLTEALRNVDLSSDEAQSTIELLNAKIEENNNLIQENSAVSQSVKKNLKELVLEIATLTIQYQSLSEEEQKSADGQALANHITDLTERAGALRDAIADTNQAISNAASDTRGLDQLGGALQLAIDGFGLATGAAEMLGISSEDLATIQTKLQAAIAASNAMQSIQNTLQSQSAVMQGVNLVQTKLRTVAENLHTAAQGKGVIATTALTAAQWAFNAAASANPIGLLVVAIVAAIAAVWGLVKTFQAFFGASDEALQKYQDQKKAHDDLCEANDRLIDRMKARGATEAELLNQSLRNKQAEKEAADALFARAKELYDEDEDEYKEALEAKKKADEAFAKTKEDSLNYLLRVIHESEEEEKKQRLGTYEYKRQIIQAELEQQKALAETLLDQAKISRKVYENLCASLDKAAKLKIDGVNADEAKANSRKKVGGSSSSLSGNIDPQKAVEELRKAVRAGEDGLVQLITDSLERQRQAELNSYHRRIEDLNKEYEKRKKILVKNKDGLAQLEVAHHRELEGLAAEHNKKLENLEISRLERVNKTEADYIESHLNAVEKGSAEEIEWMLKDLDNKRKAEYLSIYKAEQELTLTTEEANEMRANVVLKYLRLETAAREQFTKERAQRIQEQYAIEEVKREDQFNKSVANLKKRYAEELALANNNADKREAIERKYQEDMAALETEYEISTAKATVEMLEKVLQEEGLAADERLKIEAEFAKAKLALEKATTEAEIRAIQDKYEAERNEMEKGISATQRWADKVKDLLTSVNELMSAIHDARISKIEAEQETQEKAADDEQERITRLVEQNVITQEEGEARKRAAEEKSQKKTEELELKKAQIKQRQAIYDKALSIANIGLNTAMALMQLWVKPGWPAAIPMMAVVGTLGALQLATALATPIPKYAKGTDNHKGGPAIVGDGGRHEVVMFNGSAWLTPDKPIIVDLPKGAEVIPDIRQCENLVNVRMPVHKDDKQIVMSGYNDREMLRSVWVLAELIRQNTKDRRALAYRQEFEQFKAMRGL